MVSDELSEHNYQPLRSAQLSLYGVYEISKLLTSPARLEVLLSSVVNLLSSFLDMRHGLIALLGPDGEPELLVGANCTDAMARRYFEELPEQADRPHRRHSDAARRGERARRRAVRRPAVGGLDQRDGRRGLHWSADQRSWARDRYALHRSRERPRGSGRTFRFDDDVRFLTMVANLLGQAVRLQRFVATDRERLLEEQRRLEKAFNHCTTPMRPGRHQPRRADRGTEPRDPRRARQGSARRAQPLHGAPARRVRHRQGAICARAA